MTNDMDISEVLEAKAKKADEVMTEIVNLINQSQLDHEEAIRIWSTLLILTLKDALKKDEVLKSQISEIENEAMARAISFIMENYVSKTLELKELFKSAVYLHRINGDIFLNKALQEQEEE